MKPIKVAIIGVGNCASSLVQGVEYYRNNNSSQGLIHDRIGGYGAGDVAEMDAGQDHEPIAEPGEACICLIATQGRLRMHGLMARLLQPLVGV